MRQVLRRIVTAAAVATWMLALVGQFETARAADDWQAGAGPEWQKTLEQGRKEGTVSVALTFSALATPMRTAFERDTGIKIEFLTGSISDVYSRLFREAKSNNVTLDLAISGGGVLPLLQSGNLLAIAPQFMLPGVTDPKVWVGGKIHWMDNANAYLFEGSEYVFGWPLVNSSLVDPKTLTSWKDFLKPEFKSKIVADDPRVPGAGQSVAAYLATVFGMDFVKQLYVGQEVKYTSDARQLVEWVTRGQASVALGAIQPTIETFRQQGMKQLAVLSLPDGPGTLLGGFGVLAQLKGGPHPNAAKVFINWFASRPAMEIYSRVTLEASTRADVKVAELPDYVVPRPGVSYQNQYQETWYARERPVVQKAIIEALGGR